MNGEGENASQGNCEETARELIAAREKIAEQEKTITQLRKYLEQSICLLVRRNLEKSKYSPDASRGIATKTAKNAVELLDAGFGLDGLFDGDTLPADAPQKHGGQQTLDL